MHNFNIVVSLCYCDTDSIEGAFQSKGCKQIAEDLDLCIGYNLCCVLLQTSLLIATSEIILSHSHKLDYSDN